MKDDLADWERLLSAERHIQHLLPSADHVVADLRERFDEVLAQLESAAGWQTERVVRPVMILGALDGIATGIRQLRRTQPLETELRDGLRVPTSARAAHGSWFPRRLADPYRLARRDSALAQRMLGVVHRVPLPFPHFWLAALANLDQPVDFDAPLPRYDLSAET